MPLTEELAFYRANKPDLLAKYVGKYALIKGSRLVGSFDTREAAYDAGVRAFGTESFLIQLISDDEPRVEIPAMYCGFSNAPI